MQTNVDVECRSGHRLIYVTCYANAGSLDHHHVEKFMRVSFLCAAVTVLSACQWVKPTEESAHVSVVKPAHAFNCQKLGSTTSSVKGRIGFFERSNAKVGQELVTLAKNEAARIGGNTLVAKGSISEGSQVFDVFRCP